MTVKLQKTRLEGIAEKACPGCGSCSGLFTANQYELFNRSFRYGFAL